MSPRRRSEEEEDADELSRLREAAIVVFIALSTFIIIADVFAERRADGVIAGLVFGTLLSLLGLEGIQRLIDRDGPE